MYLSKYESTKAHQYYKYDYYISRYDIEKYTIHTLQR